MKDLFGDTRTRAIHAIMMLRQHIAYLKMTCEPLSKLQADELEQIEALLNVQTKDLAKLWGELRAELELRK